MIINNQIDDEIFNLCANFKLAFNKRNENTV